MYAIMKEFVTTRFFELDPDEDIMEAYFEYEKERLQAFIEEFSHANSLDPASVLCRYKRYHKDYFSKFMRIFR